MKPQAPAPAPRPATGQPPPVPTEAVLRRIRTSAREAARDNVLEVTFEALGTRCRIQFTAPTRTARQLRDQALHWVAHFEATYSRFLPDSLISRINAAAGLEPVAIDPDTEQLLALCDQLHFISRGTFDPSALPLLHAWNWKAPNPTIPDAPTLANARRLTGWRRIQRQPGRIFLPEPGMGLDLGGIGKEFAVDRIAEFLASEGAGGVLVDFGADVRVIGQPPDGRPGWHIGLDDPRQPGRCWCGLGIAQGGVATSGDYIRRFEIAGRRYGHILDPRSGQPVDNGCLAVSVLAPTCLQAGILSTALFILGPDQGLPLAAAQPGTEAAILTDRGTVTSRSFHAYVTSQAHSHSRSQS